MELFSIGTLRRSVWKCSSNNKARRKNEHHFRLFSACIICNLHIMRDRAFCSFDCTCTGTVHYRYVSISEIPSQRMHTVLCRKSVYPQYFCFGEDVYRAYRVCLVLDPFCIDYTGAVKVHACSYSYFNYSTPPPARRP